MGIYKNATITVARTQSVLYNMQIASVQRTRMDPTPMHYLLLWPVLSVAAAVPVCLFMAISGRAPRISDLR